SRLTALPPPHSLLFPYTTLFRSERNPPAIGPAPDAAELAIIRPHAVVGLPAGKDREPGVGQVRLVLGVASQPLEDLEPHRPPVVDRKSTRLNSSHRTISYAVFCL